MSTLHFEFKPLIAFFDSQGNLVKQSVFPTENPYLDTALLLGIRQDRIGYAKNFSRWGDPQLSFDPWDNLIHVQVKTFYPVAQTDLDQLFQNFIENEGGPSRWMESDLTVVDMDVAEKYGFGSIELHPYIQRITQIFSPIEK